MADENKVDPEDRSSDTFIFNSREEVVLFNDSVKLYLEEKKLQVLPYYSLIEAYDKLESRLFYSYFDIVISIIHLDHDIWTTALIWNERFGKKEKNIGSILDSKEKFSGKMDIHRFQVSFVLRYRAMWDKIMGFLILVFSPEDYDVFAKAASRKKSFKSFAQKHLKEWPYFSKFIDILDGPITQFDNEFRTPEAHFTGRLRKWSFLIQPWSTDRSFELYGYFNLMNGVMTEIRKKLIDH